MSRITDLACPHVCPSSVRLSVCLFARAPPITRIHIIVLFITCGINASSANPLRSALMLGRMQCKARRLRIQYEYD